MTELELCAASAASGLPAQATGSSGLDPFAVQGHAAFARALTRLLYNLFNVGDEETEDRSRIGALVTAITETLRSSNVELELVFASATLDDERWALRRMLGTPDCCNLGWTHCGSMMVRPGFDPADFGVVYRPDGSWVIRITPGLITVSGRGTSCWQQLSAVPRRR